MVLTFWLCVAFVLGTYAGYPLAIATLASLRTRLVRDPAAVQAWPSITVICAAHNEAARVAAKIASIGSQVYPGQVQVVFVSDGSTDDTASRIREHRGVLCLEFPERRGKPCALNRAVEVADGEVLVFTDARQEIGADAFRVLVAQLLDARVGAVSGWLVHRDPVTQQAQDIGLYWRYERWIRNAECRWYSTVGASGALYALRKSDFRALPEDTLLDDFEIPMNAVRQGKRILIDERAQVFDELQKDARGERTRKIRTLMGNFQSFARNPWLFSPVQNPVFLQFLCHKVFRLLVPYALLAAFAASWAGDDPLLRILAWLQTAGYLAAAAGMVSRPIRSIPGVSLLVVFCELNVAAVIAFLRYLRGPANSRWEKT